MGLNKNMMGGGSIFRKSSPYPQCRIFHCTRSRGVKMACCFYCDRRGICGDPCLNHPEKCGMCVLPPKEKEDDIKTITDFDLPDAPDIARAERTGLRPHELPFEDEAVKCPICGQICETIYKDVDEDCCGCENCVKRMDAYEYQRMKGGQDD